MITVFAIIAAFTLVTFYVARYISQQSLPFGRRELQLFDVGTDIFFREPCRSAGDTVWLHRADSHTAQIRYDGHLCVLAITVNGETFTTTVPWISSAIWTKDGSTIYFITTEHKPKPGVMAWATLRRWTKDFGVEALTQPLVVTSFHQSIDGHAVVISGSFGGGRETHMFFANQSQVGLEIALPASMDFGLLNAGQWAFLASTDRRGMTIFRVDGDRNDPVVLVEEAKDLLRPRVPEADFSVVVREHGNRVIYDYSLATGWVKYQPLDFVVYWSAEDRESTGCWDC